jgi:hypothetical protein
MSPVNTTFFSNPEAVIFMLKGYKTGNYLLFQDRLMLEKMS